MHPPVREDGHDDLKRVTLFSVLGNFLRDNSLQPHPSISMSRISNDPIDLSLAVGHVDRDIQKHDHIFRLK